MGIDPSIQQRGTEHKIHSIESALTSTSSAPTLIISINGGGFLVTGQNAASLLSNSTSSRSAVTVKSLIGPASLVSRQYHYATERVREIAKGNEREGRVYQKKHIFI